MERLVGTTVRGLRAPVIKTGDDLKSIVVETVLKAAESGEFTIRDRDVLAVTESIVARSQGNYCTIDDIAEDVREKLGGEDIGVVFPITSRNRFAIVLRGIARGAKKIYLMLSYPSDEVGNHLFDAEIMDDKDVDPYTDVLNEEQFISLFGQPSHPFTGMNYVDYYKKLVEAEGCEVEFVFANNAAAILNYTKNVLACDIHTRFRTKKLLKKHGAERVIGMDDLMTESRNGSGFNAQYGLLGSNKATEDTVKLFPTGCKLLADEIQAEIKEKTGLPVIKMVKPVSESDIIAARQCVADLILLDSGNGTGKVFDWSLIKDFDRDYILAGGLSPDNVGDAVARLRPFAVDVSSGVEEAGIKDFSKMKAFASEVRKI